ncbi:MAG: MBL fold metallo-hydrolase [Aigarchaeota archaeon]|nr:MBL fold metallo-hydrolase [Aigarchaeota archaeon]MCX8193170.1 MBL fold metallo-hydrolase [Nitrososphaeria archaeon]MDW7986311.1 MBL fold metallo-hydrolase [Nitrososphaerota archaeon]
MCPSRALKKIYRDVYYIPGRTNVGIVCRDDWCIVIDSGLDEDQGRRIINIVKESGLELKYLLNTHSHADHIGGNNIIMNRTSSLIIAPTIESYFIENPILEPIYLYGAYPPKGLRDKFFMAQPSRVDKNLQSGLDNEIGLEFIQLPGHSFNMYGVIVDDVFFIADLVFPENLIDKYGVLYHFDVKESVKTLKKIKETAYRFYVPSHSEPTTDISRLIDVNLQSIDKVKRLIEEYTSRPLSLEDIVSNILKDLNISITPSTYFLYNSAVRSYISWMADEELLSEVLDNGRLKYFRVR